MRTWISEEGDNLGRDLGEGGTRARIVNPAHLHHVDQDDHYWIVAFKNWNRRLQVENSKGSGYRKKKQERVAHPLAISNTDLNIILGEAIPRCLASEELPQNDGKGVHIGLLVHFRVVASHQHRTGKHLRSRITRGKASNILQFHLVNDRRSAGHLRKSKVAHHRPQNRLLFIHGNGLDKHVGTLQVTVNNSNLLHVTHGGGNIAAGGKERKRIRQPTKKKKREEMGLPSQL